MLWRLWSIWDVSGRDPYCVFNSLQDDYTPVEGGGGPLPPPYPDRLQAVLFAFGAFSQQRREDLAGAKRRPVRKRKGE